MKHIPVGDFVASPKMFEYVNDVLTSGQISYGKYSREFERRFADLHWTKYAILSNSGTSALQVALQAMKEIHLWEDGARVIIPVTTFIATANIVRHCRMLPVFVDVDKETYNLDVEKVIPLLSKDVKVIIPVHLLGQPANVTALKFVIQQQGLDIKIIEDACETAFIGHNGRPVGNLGDIGCFSTYNAHVVTTGVGGVSLTDNAKYAAKMRSLTNHGLCLEQLNPDENFSPQPMRGRRFRFETYGHSYRITEFEAALGVAQLDNWAGNIITRQRNALHYRERLYEINQKYGNVLHFQSIQPENDHAYMMFGIVLNQRDNKLVDKTPLLAFLNERGIETRDIPSCLGHPVYSWLHPEDYPVSNWIYQSGFYVGCGPTITLDDVDFVCDAIDNFLGKKNAG